MKKIDMLVKTYNSKHDTQLDEKETKDLIYAYDLLKKASYLGVIQKDETIEDHIICCEISNDNREIWNSINIIDASIDLYEQHQEKIIADAIEEFTRQAEMFISNQAKKIIEMEDFELLITSDNNHFHLHDLQGANLGCIEDEKFDNLSQVIERMSIYHDDYIYNPIEDRIDDNEIILIHDDDLINRRFIDSSYISQFLMNITPEKYESYMKLENHDKFPLGLLKADQESCILNCLNKKSIIECNSDVSYMIHQKEIETFFDVLANYDNNCVLEIYPYNQNPKKRNTNLKYLEHDISFIDSKNGADIFIEANEKYNADLPIIKIYGQEKGEVKETLVRIIPLYDDIMINEDIAHDIIKGISLCSERIKDELIDELGDDIQVS